MTTDAQFPDFTAMSNRDLVETWVKLVTAMELTRGVSSMFDTEASALYYPAVKDAAWALMKRMHGIGDADAYEAAGEAFDRVRETATAEVNAKLHKDALGVAPADWVQDVYRNRWEREATARWSQAHRDRCATVDAYVDLLDAHLGDRP